MAGKKVTRRRAPNGQLREKANQAVARFLLSNPAPYSGEFWKVGDVSTHGFYMFMAGYRQHQSDQRSAQAKLVRVEETARAGKKGR